ncbi:hypothetical protein CDG81_02670 [Actinopolyspora erythraea]|uniref:Uncharacterized protein n=1 Tax=Actinopolyspora erythraea TaxID=414996 RepID=A0A223RNK3_9ACTN|nr:hypothetical protein [Actinopolyspora erythraea]ASU77387.1 hypothetical protein CDG81_02670 [Actinopolyspora erythraea]
MHHHCYAHVEWSTDPNKWSEQSRNAPSLVAWQPGDVLRWVYQQLADHADQTEEAHDRRGHLEEALASFPGEGALSLPVAEIPDRWQYLAAALSHGRWSIQPWHLSFRKVLVLHVLSYADAGQQSGNYYVCRDHERPADQPYRAPGDPVEVP